MKYLSICSGIEAASVAWHPLGWVPLAFSEIEKFPSAVLAHHYPHVPNLGDMTQFKDWPDVRPDILVGGTPCQSFSVAGLRKGMADPRGNLTLTYLAILNRYRPEWCVWENVPGVLSSGNGRDFGAFLGGLAELGYGFAYRVLDAQFVRVDGFGRAVPQRRRRVFVVGNLRDWRRAAAVLFERESMSGNSAPRRETGQRIAPTVSARPSGGGGLGTDFDLDGGLLAFGGNNTSGPIEVATAVNAHGGPAGRLDFESETFVRANGYIASGDGFWRDGIGPLRAREQDSHENLVAHSLRGEGFDASEDGTGRGTPLVPIAYSAMPMNSGKDFVVRETDVAQPIMAAGPALGNQGGDYIAQPVSFGGQMSTPMWDFDLGQTLQAKNPQAVAFDMRGREGGSQFEGPHETANIRAASGGSSRSYVAQSWAVRRLTPRECERLQGFPDGYTNIPWRGKSTAPDGPRYKSLGNSMAANVMRWLGTRIQMVSEIPATAANASAA